jgi:hypothetical protein
MTPVRIRWEVANTWCRLKFGNTSQVEDLVGADGGALAVLQVAHGAHTPLLSRSAVLLAERATALLNTKRALAQSIAKLVAARPAAGARCVQELLAAVRALTRCAR